MVPIKQEISDLVIQIASSCYYTWSGFIFTAHIPSCTALPYRMLPAMLCIALSRSYVASATGINLIQSPWIPAAEWSQNHIALHLYRKWLHSSYFLCLHDVNVRNPTIIPDIPPMGPLRNIPPGVNLYTPKIYEIPPLYTLPPTILYWPPVPFSVQRGVVY